MASNYLSSSGGDDDVVSGTLKISGVVYTAGNPPPAIVVASSGASHEDISGTPGLPLFSPSGSHIQVINDPEGNGNIYRVKAYVTAPDGGVTGVLGLAVVVEWQRPGSAVVHRSSVFSSAYAPVGGCGSLDKAPFLTSCQPQYRSSANTASTSVLVSANEYDPLTNAVGDARAVVPGATPGGINSAGARARAASDSAQSTVVTGTVNHSVSSITPLNSDDPASIVGGATYVSQASDNTADPDAPPAHGGLTAGGGTPALAGISGACSSISVNADDDRWATAYASTTNSCAIIGANSVPAHQPCAYANLGAGDSSLEATGVIEGNQFDYATTTLAAANDSKAWVGRFQLGGTSGNAVVGCGTLSGAGCVAAGAISYVPTIAVGLPPAGWFDGAAWNGLVVIDGYHDSVLVERGAAHADARRSRAGEPLGIGMAPTTLLHHLGCDDRGRLVDADGVPRRRRRHPQRLRDH